VRVAAVIVLVAAAAFAGIQARRSQEWENRAVAALASADTLQARADSLVAVADAAEERARQLAWMADEMGRQVRERVERVRDVAVPDTCAPFVVPRDAIIDTLVIVVESWRTAFDEQIKAGVALRSSNLTLRSAVDSLEAVLRDRPGSRSPWVPKLGLGAFTGICVGGQPCLGAGVTLSWSTP